MDQRDYWNANIDPHNLGGTFDAGRFDYAAELTYYLTPDQREALGWMEPFQGKRVLDVGAGLGMNSLYLARQGARVVAIDIARERLRALRTLAAEAGAGEILLVQCSANALPFRPGTFDHACSRAVLIHTRLEESVSELYRTLRSGGSGAFLEPMTRNPLVNAYRRTLAPREWRTITRYFAEPELEIFRRTFDRTEVSFHYLTAFLAFGWQFAVRVPVLFRITLAVLNGVDRTLMKLMPPLGRYAWFAAIRGEKK